MAKAKAPALQQGPTPKSLTPEEKEAQIQRFLAQKKEMFFQMFSGSLARGLDYVPTKEEALALVDLSIEMADRALEKLYIPPKEAIEKKEAEEKKECSSQE